MTSLSSAFWGASVSAQHWVVPTGYSSQDWGAGGQSRRPLTVGPPGMQTRRILQRLSW